MTRGVVLLVVVLAGLPGTGLAGEARVGVYEGLVSATFEATLASEALAAIGRATGMEVVVPPSVQGRALTLTVESVSLEWLLERVVAALDLGGFALVYKPDGRAGRLLVVDRTPGGLSASTESAPGPAYGVEAAKKRWAPAEAAAPPVAPGAGPDRDGEQAKIGSRLPKPSLVSEAELARAREISEAAVAAIPLVRGDRSPARPDRILPFPAPDGSLIPIPE